jgi:peptide deformylase
MAILNILEFPDPRLRKKAAPVETVDEAVRRVVDDMLETMYEADGVGLAAIQVNVRKRIIVMDVSDIKNTPLCFINPEIVGKEGARESEEGCLSVPGFVDTVKRAERVRVRALDRAGEPLELSVDGLMAVCIQHEIDHLDGKLFVDYLSPLKRQRIRKKLEKAHRFRSGVESEARSAL